MDNSVLELYINQFTSATLASPLVGLSVQLEASFFQGADATVNITFAQLPASGTADGQSRDAAEFALKLRIPSWAVSSGVQVEVNGQPWAGCTPTAGPQAGSFCTVRRVFSAGIKPAQPLFPFLHHSFQTKSLVLSGCTVTCLLLTFLSGCLGAGDHVVLVLPMSIRAERVQDDRPEYSSFHVGTLVMQSPAITSCINALLDVAMALLRYFAPLQAVMMGPLLMAGLTHGDRSIEADPGKVADLLTDVSSKGLASLVLPAADPPMHIRHDGNILRADMTRAATSLDGTFRLLSLDDRYAEESSHYLNLSLNCICCRPAEPAHAFE